MDRLRNLSISVGKYRDGTWHVAMCETLYDHGHSTGTTITANRWLSETQVLDQVAKALQHAMDMESARLDLERARAVEGHPSARRARR